MLKNYKNFKEEQTLVYQYVKFSDQDLKEEKLIIDNQLIFECDFEQKNIILKT